MRLSVGIEHIEDLLTDLEQALENGVAAGRRDAQRTHRNGSVVKAEAAHRG